jgi:hypothetical protein
MEYKAEGKCKDEAAKLIEEDKAQSEAYSILKEALIVAKETGNIYTIYNIVIDQLSRYAV